MLPARPYLGVGGGPADSSSIELASARRPIQDEMRACRNPYATR